MSAISQGGSGGWRPALDLPTDRRVLTRRAVGRRRPGPHRLRQCSGGRAARPDRGARSATSVSATCSRRPTGSRPGYTWPSSSTAASTAGRSSAPSAVRTGRPVPLLVSAQVLRDDAGQVARIPPPTHRRHPPPQPASPSSAVARRSSPRRRRSPGSAAGRCASTHPTSRPGPISSTTFSMWIPTSTSSRASTPSSASWSRRTAPPWSRAMPAACASPASTRSTCGSACATARCAGSARSARCWSGPPTVLRCVSAAPSRTSRTSRRASWTCARRWS